MSDYHTKLGKAIESAAEKLPDGYTINIVVEHNGGNAVLYDDEGEECAFPSNHECLADEINDAVEFAIQDEINLDRMRNQD